jgi:hypothetical protein
MANTRNHNNNYAKDNNG